MLTLLLRDAVTTNLYTNDAKTQTTYIIPGPPLYGSGSGAPAPPPSTVRLLMGMLPRVLSDTLTAFTEHGPPRPPHHDRLRAPEPVLDRRHRRAVRSVRR